MRVPKKKKTAGVRTQFKKERMIQGKRLEERAERERLDWAVRG